MSFPYSIVLHYFVSDPSSNDDLVGDEDRSLNVQGYTPLLKERNEQLESMDRTDQRSI